MQWADVIWNLYESLRTFAVEIMDWLFSPTYVNLDALIDWFFADWVADLIPSLNFYIISETTLWYDVIFGGAIVSIVTIAIVLFLIRAIGSIIDIFT